MRPLSERFKKELSENLRASAEAAWKRLPSGLYTVPMQKGTLMDLSSLPELDLAKATLEEFGLKGVFDLASTLNTDVFWGTLENGQQIALRHGECSGAAKRSKSPITLQSYRTWNSAAKRSIKLEAFPLVAMDDFDGGTLPEMQMHNANISHIEHVAEIMMHILTEAGFEVIDEDLLIRDLAILPNGLPVQVDPDSIDDPYDDNDLPECLEAFIHLQEELNLPKELKWIDEDGERTQDKLLPNPFEL